MKKYSQLLNAIEKIEKLLITISVAAMLIVMLYQIILRYVFHSANAWSEELARYLFIFQVMLAAAIAIRKNNHLQIDALINFLPPRWKIISTLLSTIVGIIFLLFLLVSSIDLVKTGASNLSVGLGVPMSNPYLCLPIGSILMLLTSVEVVFEQIDSLQKMKEEKK